MRRSRSGLAASVGTAAVVAAGALPAPAPAYDNYPCAQASSPGAAQVCPLAALIDGGRIPVYTAPVPRPNGAPVPAPRSWVQARDGSQGKESDFACETDFQGSGVYWHPNNRWYNDWWARVARAEDGQPGWVPEVFFKGGDNLEADFGLRECPQAASPPPSGPCQPAPAVAGLSLHAAFKRSRHIATRTYGQRARVRGRLTQTGGVPVAGATLCVGVQRRADDPVQAMASITTNVRGRFTYKIPAGASRRIWFVHRTVGGAAASSVDLKVRAPISLHATPRALRNGRSTLFHGRLRGSGHKRGLIVELQYPQRGRWQTFATTHVRRKGRFRYRYRFTRTFGTTTYSLRARVTAQRGYPFVAGSSRTVRVRVLG